MLRAITLAAFAGLALPGAGAELTVSAAASLTNAFSEIAQLYDQAHPGTRVLLNFGASGSLLQQIARGAPVDVFASADLETMNRAENQNLIVRETRSDFITNKLVVVVPAGATRQLRSLADLRAPQFARLGIGIPDSVPAGRYAKQALERGGHWDALRHKYIFGQNVRQVLDYVARGEVDAGFVYGTDAALIKAKVEVALQIETDQPIRYPIAVVKDSANQAQARRFIAFVKSDAGQQVLAKFGFATQ